MKLCTKRQHPHAFLTQSRIIYTQYSHRCLLVRINIITRRARRSSLNYYSLTRTSINARNTMAVYSYPVTPIYGNSNPRWPCTLLQCSQHQIWTLKMWISFDCRLCLALALWYVLNKPLSGPEATSHKLQNFKQLRQVLIPKFIVNRSAVPRLGYKRLQRPSSY